MTNLVNTMTNLVNTMTNLVNFGQTNYDKFGKYYDNHFFLS